MATIQVTIEGKTPLLMSRFTDADQMSASEGTRPAIKPSSSTPHDVAQNKMYVDSDGNPGIPGPNLFRCIIDAGKFHKVGKSKVTTVKSSLIPACVAIEPLFIPVEHDQPWEVDTRPVRVPATGGRILAHRPMFNDWKLSFEVELDEDVMTTKTLRDIVDDGGSKIGLGDFRPDRKGPFGRFVVTKWEVS